MKNIPLLISYYSKDYKKLAKEAKDSNNFLYGDWWYLHGELSSLLGYDKASIINGSECKDLVRMIPKYSNLRRDFNSETLVGTVENINLVPELYINDIIECKVYGISEKCIGYFWTIEEKDIQLSLPDNTTILSKYWRQRGLVCLESATEDRNYALDCFLKREVCL